MFSYKKIYIPVLISFFAFSFCAAGGKYVTTSSGLQYTTIKKGEGLRVKAGQEILMREKMSYLSGKLLFSSYTLPQPIKILLGGHQAVDGVDEGMQGMKKGEIRKLIVPPALSKRTVYPDFLHPDSTLVYEVELVDILPPKS